MTSSAGDRDRELQVLAELVAEPVAQKNAWGTLTGVWVQYDTRRNRVRRTSEPRRSAAITEKSDANGSAFSRGRRGRSTMRGVWRRFLSTLFHLLLQLA